MKKIFFILFLFLTAEITAQNKQYYNWDWKPCDVANARFVSLVEQTDSGWVRRDFFLSTKKSQMKGIYKDSILKIKNGWFRYFYVNQVLSSQGNYVNGEKDGLWLSYYFDGLMKDSVEYESGSPKSIKAWHNNGYIADSSIFNKEGAGIHTFWFDNGQLSHSGRSFRGKKEGKWQYFHKNGKPAAIEEYEQDKLVNRIYYDESGIQITDTASKDRAAEFKGGSKKWKAFLFNNLDFLDEVKLKNTNAVTVVLAITIDEDGNLTDAYVDVPVSPKFDEAALKVIRKSPPWIPAISHNRHVKYFLRQAITFNQF